MVALCQDLTFNRVVIRKQHFDIYIFLRKNSNYFYFPTLKIIVLVEFWVTQELLCSYRENFSLNINLNEYMKLFWLLWFSSFLALIN